MEKGFNDDELADIMNEIESLEQEFSDEVAKVSAEVDSTELDDFDANLNESNTTSEMQESDEKTAEQEGVNSQAENESILSDEDAFVAEPLDEINDIQDESLEASSQESFTESNEEIEASSQEEIEREIEASSQEEDIEKEIEEIEAISEEDLDDEIEEIEEFESVMEDSEFNEVHDDFKGGSVNEVLTNLTDMPVEEIVRPSCELENDFDNVHHLRTSETTNKNEQIMNNNEVSNKSYNNNNALAETSMNFKVEGNMSIDLKFEIGGNVVNICVNEAEGLSIEMESGAKITLPVNTNAVKKVS